MKERIKNFFDIIWDIFSLFYGIFAPFTGIALIIGGMVEGFRFSYGRDSFLIGTFLLLSGIYLFHRRESKTI